MTGTGLAVARTRGALASLFAATRLSRAIQAPTRLGVDTCALALRTSGRALNKKATHGGHPVVALSGFFSRRVDFEIGLTPRRCKKKFPPRPFFLPGPVESTRGEAPGEAFGDNARGAGKSDGIGIKRAIDSATHTSYTRPPETFVTTLKETLWPSFPRLKSASTRA